MTIVFRSMLKEECLRYIATRPHENLLLEKDIFSGYFQVLNAQ